MARAEGSEQKEEAALSLRGLRYNVVFPPIALLCIALGWVVALEFRRAATWSDHDETEQQHQNDVTLALMRLLRTQDTTPEVFTCPATQPTHWDFGGGANTALKWSNWRGESTPANLRYQNPFEKTAESRTVNTVQSSK